MAAAFQRIVQINFQIAQAPCPLSEPKMTLFTVAIYASQLRWANKTAYVDVKCSCIDRDYI